jgi:trans-aconitate methyltransferase
MPSRILGLPARALRHLLLDQSYGSYYSSEIWEKKYRDENYDLGDPKEDGRYGALLQVLRRYDRGSLIDLGCGDGLLWRHYRPLSDARLIGVDYSDTAVAKANARGLERCQFLTADYRTFVPPGQVSVVVFNESLYYIEDFEGALDRAEAWLDQDGCVVVSMFDTLVTSRIWKRLAARRKWIQSLKVQDHASKVSWTIRVLAKSGKAAR